MRLAALLVEQIFLMYGNRYWLLWNWSNQNLNIKLNIKLSKTLPKNEFQVMFSIWNAFEKKHQEDMQFYLIFQNKFY